MQELIDKIKLSYLDELEVLKNPDKYHIGDVKQARLIAHNFANIVNMAEKLLEKEKDQLLNAFRDNSWNKSFNEYYNETYNQDK